MSFGTKISFGRWCRKGLFGEDLDHKYDSFQKFTFDAKARYYNEDDYCYFTIRNWVDFN